LEATELLMLSAGLSTGGRGFDSRRRLPCSMRILRQTPPRMG